MDAQAQQDILQSAADDLKSIHPRIKQAEALVTMLENAGEDVTKHKQQLRELKTKAGRWEQSIAAHMKGG